MKIEQLYGSCGCVEDPDLGRINVLMRQLSPNATELTAADVGAVIARSEIFLARDKQRKIVGMATLITVRSLKGKEGRVESVVVDEAERGKGIAKLLMRTLVEFARRTGLLRIELTSRPHREAAHALYLTLGFEQRDTNVYRLTLG